MRITFKDLLQHWPLKVEVPTKTKEKKVFRNIDLKREVADSPKRR